MTFPRSAELKEAVLGLEHIFLTPMLTFSSMLQLPLVYQVCAKLCTLKTSFGRTHGVKNRIKHIWKQGLSYYCYGTVFSANLRMQVRYYNSSWRNVMLTVFGNKIIITVCISDKMRFNPFDLLIVCHTTLKMDTTIVSTAQKYEIQSNMHNVLK